MRTFISAVYTNSAHTEVLGTDSDGCKWEGKAADKYYGATYNEILDQVEHIDSYVAPVIPVPEPVLYTLERLRSERNVKLTESDWTQLPDSPLTPEQKAAWATYRQALRDITEGLDLTLADYSHITFPNAP